MLFLLTCYLKPNLLKGLNSLTNYYNLPGNKLRQTQVASLCNSPFVLLESRER